MIPIHHDNDIRTQVQDPAFVFEDLKAFLEGLRRRFHRRQETRHDPVHFLYRYPNMEDREIIGVVASALAFGAVEQILRALSGVLNRFPCAPHEFCEMPKTNIVRHLLGFKYRFVDDEDLAELLCAIGIIRRQYGSLNACFCSFLKESDSTVEPALQHFLRQLRQLGRIGRNYLVPFPDRGGACKRMHLFLRWMVRKDTVDPGGWVGIIPAKLIVPLDVHIVRLGRLLNMTNKRTPDGKMAREITAFFRRLCPEDPVKYDFALMRYGAMLARKNMREYALAAMSLEGKSK